MISFTKAFQTSDGKTYATLEDAQRFELAKFFETTGGDKWSPTEIAGTIIGNSPAIIDILTTTASSRPAARKTNGGTKKRKSKATVGTLPLEESAA